MTTTTLLSIVALVVAGLALAIAYLAWKAAGELVYPPHQAATSSPDDYGLHAESITFRSAGGPQLRGWWIPTAMLAKGTIILSHGYTGDCSPDLVYAPLLNQAGFNVCLFDYRGHGMSEGNYTSLVYYERKDLETAIDFLHSRGVERVGLMGFSMGGAIALSTAHRCQAVVGVITDSAFGELSAILENAAITRGVPARLARPLAWLVECLACFRLRANLFAADPIRWAGKIAPRPILVIHGAEDRDVPVEQARRLYRALHDPKELWIVPGAQHRRIEEVAGEEYRRRVIDFFDRAFASV